MNSKASDINSNTNNNTITKKMENTNKQIS